VNEELPSREKALRLLSQSGCSRNVIRHCKAVAGLAVEIGVEFCRKGVKVNLRLVETGALLHDIGRSETHDVDHGIVGARIAEDLGLPRPVVSIVKRHIGAGISREEAGRLGWPVDVYIPQTLEEKIVCYADKRIEGSKKIPMEEAVRAYSRKVAPAAVERILRLHLEMVGQLGDCPCLR